jgi:MoaA/NifB/PqqE/SkfB family radical SAM enzyme
MILQGRAIEEKERFIEFWRNEGIDQVTVYQLSEYDESGRIIFKKTYYDHAELGRYACAAPWLEAFVYPTGEVSLCCWTLELVPTKGILAVGNVREKRLSEIWIDEPYRRVREQLITNRFQDRLAREACKDCYVWSSSTYRRKWFGGEMSVLYNESMATYEFV